VPEPVRIVAAAADSKAETGLVSVQKASVVVNLSLALLGQCLKANPSMEDHCRLGSILHCQAQILTA